MTQEEKGLIIALTLGDGHITPQGRLCINHCEAQLEYLLYKKEIIEKIIGGKPINIHKRTAHLKDRDTSYIIYNISKCCKKKLVEFRELLYPEGKKVFTREILDQLSAKGLAIWYMDDGSLCAEKKDGKIHAYKLHLNTYLSYEENQVIVDYFKDKWNIDFHIHKDGKQYRLRINTKEARKFLDIVRPYVNEVECMKYKAIHI